jgi:large subunit ribosomal protein L25
MQIEFTAFPRSVQGTGASRRLRHAGKVPGIVYGSTEAPQTIELDHNALFHALKNEAFHSSILTMNLGNAKQRVLLRDVQHHPVRSEILHVDFQRVDDKQKIHMKVPLHFVNAEVSPAVKVGHAVISHVMAELAISCLPKDLPEFIEVDLAELTAGHSLHVKDLKLPAGLTVVIRGRDANPAVAAAVVPRGEKAEEVAPTAEGEAAAAVAGGAPGAAAAPAAEAKTTEKADKK